MASKSIEAALAAATEAYEQAKERASTMREGAWQARMKHHDAAKERDRLLAAAAEGDAGVTDEKLLEAEDATRRAAAAEDLADAKATAARRNAQKAHLAVLAAQAAVLRGDYDRCVDTQIAAAEAVDGALADLNQAISAFHQAGQAVHAAHAACRYHNDHEINPNHNHNDLLRELDPAEQPRVDGLPSVLPGQQRLTVELWRTREGVVTHRDDLRGRAVLDKVAPELRKYHNRPRPMPALAAA